MKFGVMPFLQPVYMVLCRGETQPKTNIALLLESKMK